MIVPPPPPRPVDSCCDIETYTNYLLVMFDTGEDVELFNDVPYVNGQPATREQFAQALTQALKRYRVITFNGLHYDMPIVALALGGASNAKLKEASDAIIVYGVKSWDIAEVPRWINHVDLIEVAPGQGSLKMYGGKMHSKRLQDLPFDPASVITEEMRQTLRSYCKNDLQTTRDLLGAMATQLELRDELGLEFGIDVRSKSDAQIAEAAMKALLPFKPERSIVSPGAQFTYAPPAWLRFQSKNLTDAVETLRTRPFVINVLGAPTPAHDNDLIDWGKDSLRMTPGGNWVKRPESFIHRAVQIGKMGYTFGMGGLHSTESSITHRSTPTRRIRLRDVRSYYPSLIINEKVIPPKIGLGFLQIFSAWYTDRLAAKAAGKKKKANVRKTKLNGTFGKLWSLFSIFYHPRGGVHVTITGQLSLLMLIEMLELSGIEVISANTDGIVISCPRELEWLEDEIVAWWEGVSGLVMESTDLRILASRDVNSYVAITLDGAVIAKGAYAAPEPGPSGWPNPTGQISVDAVVAYLRDGVPLLRTVMACTDIRQFVHIRGVKGGGSFAPNGTLPRKTTLKAMREATGAGPNIPKPQLIADYAALCDHSATEREYLGKAVRWIYSRGSKGCIVTPAGHLVARTEGCRPLMELPDTMPGDVDYMWYVNEAAALLADLG